MAKDAILIPAVIKTQVTKTVKAATELVVTNDAEMLEAGEIRKKIKTLGKEITSKKDEIVKPMKESMKKIVDLFKPFETDCEIADGIISKKMLAYQSIVDANRRAAEKKAQDDLEKANAQLAEGTITEAQAVKVFNKVETKLEKAPEVITKSESFHTRTVKKARITDPNLIPKEYWVIDEVAVRKAVLAGIVVPGAEIYEEKTLV